VDGGRIGKGAKMWETPKGGIWHESIPGDQRLIDNPLGRYPADLILDEESAAMLGNVSRYFHCAKASRREREAGLDGLEPQSANDGRNTPIDYPLRRGKTRRNDHPTVKPLDLCRYLAALLLPPASVAPRRLLVPFSGSGSEMIGAEQAGWDEVVGIEQNHHYCEIAKLRLEYWRTAAPPSPPARSEAA
jgi:DNA modification methylase